MTRPKLLDLFCGAGLHFEGSCAMIPLSARTEHAGFFVLSACAYHNPLIVHRVPVLSLTRAVLADVQARRHGDFAIMRTMICQHCGKQFEAQRKTRKFCSRACANRSVWAAAKTRNCLHCGKEFPLTSAADANRKHCSKACAKAHNAKSIRDWNSEHPDYMPEYQKNRAAKNPGMWREKARSDRAKALAMLGGKCIVCGVVNPNWLHIDYIPTTRNTPYRHPRHLKYIREHLSDFRILCANHHYELTLTGSIEGTDITQ
jgi:endogenous inhibitor of DNA gyrase (YacG/DUF329 family)